MNQREAVAELVKEKGMYGAVDAALRNELDDRMIRAVFDEIPGEQIQVRALMHIVSVLEKLVAMSTSEEEQ